MAKFDDVIEEVGAFGRFQAFVVLLFIGAAIPVSYNTFLPLFILTTPDHRCAIENYSNDTYRVQSEYHQRLINWSIPVEEEHGHSVLSSCHIYRFNESTLTPPLSLDYTVHNGTRANISSVPATYFNFEAGRTREPCDRWVYDHSVFDIAYSEKLDLVCDQKEFRAHSNVAMMAGKLVSALLQGFLSDRFGRRLTLLLFLSIAVCSTFANIFIFDVVTLITFRFLAGLSTTSFYMNAYVIALEFVGPQYRQRFNIIASVTWISGGFVLTGVAFFIRDSQTLVLSLAAPTVLLLAYFFVVPESPRWLLSRGRYQEAKTTLQRVARVNRRPFPSELFDKLVMEQDAVRTTKYKNQKNLQNNNGLNEGPENNGTNFQNVPRELDPNSLQDKTDEDGDCSLYYREPSKQEQFFSMFKHKALALRLLIVLWNWCANSMTYYGIIFNTPNLSGSIFLNFTITNTVDLAGNLASYYFVDKVGRKKSYVTCYFIASLALLAAIFPSIYASESDAELTVLLMTIVGRAGVSTTFNIMYLWVAELFPTTMRNSVLGACSLASRLVSTCSPYIADLGYLLTDDLAAALPMAVFGATGLLATISALFLPETVGHKLPNSIQDALEINGQEARQPPSPHDSGTARTARTNDH